MHLTGNFVFSCSTLKKIIFSYYVGCLKILDKGYNEEITSNNNAPLSEGFGGRKNALYFPDCLQKKRDRYWVTQRAGAGFPIVRTETLLGFSL